MKRICIVFLSLTFLGISLTNAQPAAHEFSVYGNGGFAANCFQPITKNVSSAGFGGDIGVGFTGFVSQQIGFQTGVGFGGFHIKSKATELLTLTPGLTDKNREPYELHTKLTGYAEIHKTLYFVIPAMVHFQTKMKQSWDWTRSQKNGFYAAAGVKVLLMINNRYESGITSLYNSAYYTRLNNWAATQAFVGLGNFEVAGNSNKGKLDFGAMAVFAIEAGMKWRLAKGSYLYTGIYFNCGLNDPTKKERQQYNIYTDPVQLKDMPLLSFAEKLNYMSAGIKVSVAFTRTQ